MAHSCGAFLTLIFRLVHSHWNTLHLFQRHHDWGYLSITAIKTTDRLRKRSSHLDTNGTGRIQAALSRRQQKLDRLRSNCQRAGLEAVKNVARSNNLRAPSSSSSASSAVAAASMLVCLIPACWGCDAQPFILAKGACRRAEAKAKQSRRRRWKTHLPRDQSTRRTTSGGRVATKSGRTASRDYGCISPWSLCDCVCVCGSNLPPTMDSCSRTLAPPPYVERRNMRAHADQCGGGARAQRDVTTTHWLELNSRFLRK